VGADARTGFETFADAFVRAYWQVVQGGEFAMPPDEPVEEIIEELLGEVSHRTEHRSGAHELHMENAHGDRWRFSFHARGGRWELVAASAASDGESSHDLLGPVYAWYFEPMLRHVVRVAHETHGI